MNLRRLLVIFFLIAGILAIPLIAMQFTDEVNWDYTDFGIAGLLLLSLAIILQFAYDKVNGKEKKIGIVLLIIFVFVLIYMELAVGIFGTPLAGS